MQEVNCAEQGLTPPATDASRAGKRAASPLLSAWPEFSDLADQPTLVTIAALERVRDAVQRRDRIVRPAFRMQDGDLLKDGLHYESRIAERAVIATREGEAHDVFNALVWLRHPRLKHALNARQVADIARVGTRQRTRGQCALTHFDEAGAIVWLADANLLAAWDAHDWSTLFLRERAAWGTRIAVTVFGHALTEHVWNGRLLPVAKALVVRVGPSALARHQVLGGAIVLAWPSREAALATAIASDRVLTDPQELRPLPLAGIPGWHDEDDIGAFVRAAPCFRPLRDGRRYPPAIGSDRVRSSSASIARWSFPHSPMKGPGRTEGVLRDADR